MKIRDLVDRLLVCDQESEVLVRVFVSSRAYFVAEVPAVDTIHCGDRSIAINAWLPDGMWVAERK